MKKTRLYIVITLLFTACSNKQENKHLFSKNLKQTETTEIKTETNKRDLIDILNDSLKNVVDISTFLDSVTRPKNIHVISILKEEWNEKEKCFYYSNPSYRFKLVQEIRMKDGEEFTNATFYDGKFKIDFADFNILKYADEEFETEDFGFNYLNSLTNCRIIQIGSNKFLYADVSFMCNGIGCGCQINMIYDLKTHIPTFIENYRFPYSNYFISDFDNNNSPDLLLITRSKNYQLKGFDLQEVGFKVLWYEHKKNGKFKMKFDSNKNPLFFHFYGITRSFDHEAVKHYSLIDQNWN